MKISNTTLTECGPTRITARSVSWNTTGNFLALGSSDRLAHVMDGSTCREILVVSGHTSPLTKVRFNPQQATQLVTADSTSVRLWDVRGGSQRAIGKVELTSPCLSLEWSQNSEIALTDRNGTISVYDSRKMANKLCAYELEESQIPEYCIFIQHKLLAGTSPRGNGVGELRIWQWAASESKIPIDLSKNTKDSIVTASIPAHCGPIYSLALSPDGQRLATGGCDATAGLWDVKTLCPISSVSRRTKFIRSVALNNKYLAVCSEDEGVDIVDSSTGAAIGVVSLGTNRSAAEEIAWHPKMDHILACARIAPAQTVSPVVVAKMTMTASQ